MNITMLLFALAAADAGQPIAYHSRIDGLVLPVEVSS